MGPLEAPLLAQARSIIDWNLRNRFCAMCGTETVSAEAGYKRHCNNEKCKANSSIQNVSYPRTDPVVISMVRRNMGWTQLTHPGEEHGGSGPCPQAHALARLEGKLW